MAPRSRPALVDSGRHGDRGSCRGDSLYGTVAAPLRTAAVPADLQVLSDLCGRQRGERAGLLQRLYVERSDFLSARHLTGPGVGALRRRDDGAGKRGHRGTDSLGCPRSDHSGDGQRSADRAGAHECDAGRTGSLRTHGGAVREHRVPLLR